MSNFAFIYLYLNMGSEMIYVVQQRLIAQNICKLRSTKILDDILIEMFNEKFLEEAYLCDRLPNFVSLKQLFTKLAHCTIMKLNDQSMDKLFDLVTMVFKYQLISCSNTSDLIQITLNHLNSISLITDKQPIRLLISLSMNRFLAGPGSFNSFIIQNTRQILLNYLVDIKTRVSVLLKLDVQCETGRIIISNKGKVACSCQVPGKMNFFDEKGQIVTVKNFKSGCSYEFDSNITSLGLDIYKKEEELNKLKENEQKNNTELKNIEDKNLKSQFFQEANLLAIILDEEKKQIDSINKDEKNEKKLKETKFWLNIDLDIQQKENKEFRLNKINEKNLNENKEIENQKLDNHEIDNMSKINLVKIQQQLDIVDLKSDQNEIKNNLDLLKLLDS